MDDQDEFKRNLAKEALLTQKSADDNRLDSFRQQIVTMALFLPTASFATTAYLIDKGEKWLAVGVTCGFLAIFIVVFRWLKRSLKHVRICLEHRENKLQSLFEGGTVKELYGKPEVKVPKLKDHELTFAAVVAASALAIEALVVALSF